MSRTASFTSPASSDLFNRATETALTYREQPTNADADAKAIDATLAHNAAEQLRRDRLT